jgi:hypothetical protein
MIGAAVLLAPAAAHATATAQFTLLQPSPCTAGSCRVVLDTIALQAPMRLDKRRAAWIAARAAR